MAGIRLTPEDSDVSQQIRPSDLVSDDDRSVAADSWSIKSDYGSTLDDDQRHADAAEALSSAALHPSDYSSDKEEPDADAVSSMLGLQSYWDSAYADELANFREHGHTGEVWFGADVMDVVGSWTKSLCINISKGGVLNHDNAASSDHTEDDHKYLSSWSVLDVGTGNGLLLQELAKQGFTDLTGVDYSEGAIDLAKSLAERDGYPFVNFLLAGVVAGDPLINGVPDGDWFCSRCSAADEPISCCLCPVAGGAVKPTADGRWAHILCALFVLEVFFRDPEGREGIDLSMVPERRWSDRCYLCENRSGCAIDCSEPRCDLTFHVTCGLEELCIEYREGKKKGAVVVGFCKKNIFHVHTRTQLISHHSQLLQILYPFLL